MLWLRQYDSCDKDNVSWTLALQFPLLSLKPQDSLGSNLLPTVLVTPLTLGNQEPCSEAAI